jgi:nucleotide-binding universal stress UspA family protein
MERMKIRRILVPTDFSHSAGEAARTAEAMARVFDAGIELFHVTATVALLPPPVEILPFSTLVPSIFRQVEERLEEEAQQVRSTGVPCDTKTVDGAPATEIVRRAQEIGVDLIVMGTHGHGGLAHAVLGSVTERVLHKAQCPVLVVPARKP